MYKTTGDAGQAGQPGAEGGAGTSGGGQAEGDAVTDVDFEEVK